MPDITPVDTISHAAKIHESLRNINLVADQLGCLSEALYALCDDKLGKRLAGMMCDLHEATKVVNAATFAWSAQEARRAEESSSNMIRAVIAAVG